MNFGIANNVRSEVRVCTPELLNDALDAPHVARTCAEIEDALEALRRGELNQDEFETLKAQLKKRLPILTPHATFSRGRRKNDEAVPSGLSMYDLDHIPNPSERWAEIAPRTQELGIVLAHITPSTEGLRLLFVMPRGMSLEEAQAWMARQLGDAQYDACVKDYARCSFLVPREYVLWMDGEGLFGSSQITVVQREGGDVLLSEAKNLGNTNENTNVDAHEILRRTAPLDDKGGDAPTDALPESKEKNAVELCVLSGETNNYPDAFKNTPYATIIAEWFRRNGGEPVPGERNAKLHRLASHLRYITDNNEEHLLQIMPSFGLKEDEMRTLIHHACVAKFYGMPRSLQKLLADLQGKREEESPEPDMQNAEQNTPPAMPKKLPPLIRLLVSRTPEIYRPAVAHAVFPALGAHLWRTYFRYIDNVLHEATLMNVLMAGTGAGKNCISDPINSILKDIRTRDRDNLLREKEWKREMLTKGANKDI